MMRKTRGLGLLGNRVQSLPHKILGLGFIALTCAVNELCHNRNEYKETSGNKTASQNLPCPIIYTLYFFTH